jgi:hypothetical protein
MFPTLKDRPKMTEGPLLKLTDALEEARRECDQRRQQRDELSRLLAESQSKLSPAPERSGRPDTNPANCRTALRDPFASLLPTEIPPLVAQAQEAFHRDLHDLLIDHRGQWVAYHGVEQVGFSESTMDLYHEGSRRGIKLNEFVVRRIDPDLLEEPVEFDVTPDV